MTTHRTPFVPRLLDIASPRTLAALIADIHCLGTGATGADMRLSEDLERELEELVGMQRSGQMIQQCCDAAYADAE